MLAVEYASMGIHPGLETQEKSKTGVRGVATPLFLYLFRQKSYD